MNKIYGYARVSTKEQNLDRQMDALINAGVSEKEIITDKQSGKDFNRSKYLNLRDNLLRPGDTLVIKELDRLGRNKAMIKQELDYLKQKKVRVKILNIPTTLIDLPEGQDWIFDMINNILIEVLAAMAEDERIKIATRRAEGIQALKARNDGKGIGRPQAQYPKNWKRVYEEWKDKDITAAKAMNLLDLKRTTFYKLVKNYESEEEQEVK